MRSALIHRCRHSTLLPLFRCVSNRRFINISGQPLDLEASPCRRVKSDHKARHPRETPIRRVNVIPLPTPYAVGERLPRVAKLSVRLPPTVNIPGPAPDLMEHLPRVTRHIVTQRFKIYIPGSPPPTKVIGATDVRKIVLGPTIKRSFIRRTFHPLDKRSNLIENEDTVVRLVRSTQEDPFPEHQEARGPEIPLRNQAHLGPRPVSRYLSIAEHIIDRPEVKTTYVDTHCCLSTTLRILKDVGTLVH